MHNQRFLNQMKAKTDTLAILCSNDSEFKEEYEKTLIVETGSILHQMRELKTKALTLSRNYVKEPERLTKFAAILRAKKILFVPSEQQQINLISADIPIVSTNAAEKFMERILLHTLMKQILDVVLWN